MPYRSLICSFLSSLVIFVVSLETRPQSGRGRPKVPVPSQPAAPQPAVRVPESTVVVKQEQAGNASRFVLRNGMTVVLREQHAYPCAAIVAYFKTGRLNEPESKLGRVLQKAVIDGDLQSAPFKNARTIRALGGKLTVEASLDHAYFCIMMPAKNVNEVLAAQADMLLHPSLTPYSARRAAMAIEAEEGRRCQDPAEYSNSQVKEMAASDSNSASYTGDIIAGGRQDRLTDFYKSRYRPENLVVSVVGDVPTFDTLVQIERLYADFGTVVENEEAGDKSGAAAKPGTMAADSAAGGVSSGGQKPVTPRMQRDSQNESQ